jgi:hypothetical protein
MTYTCSLCEGQNGEAIQIITNLRNGDTLAACDPCAPVALIGSLATELGVDAGKLYDSIRRFADKQAKAEAQAQVNSGQNGEAAAGIDDFGSKDLVMSGDEGWDLGEDSEEDSDAEVMPPIDR